MLPDAAWGFFTGDSVALIGLMGQIYNVNRKAKRVVRNTHSVSNGAIPALSKDITFIKGYVISLSDRVDRIERKISK